MCPPWGRGGLAAAGPALRRLASAPGPAWPPVPGWRSKKQCLCHFGEAPWGVLLRSCRPLFSPAATAGRRTAATGGMPREGPPFTCVPPVVTPAGRRASASPGGCRAGGVAPWDPVGPSLSRPTPAPAGGGPPAPVSRPRLPIGGVCGASCDARLAIRLEGPSPTGGRGPMAPGPATPAEVCCPLGAGGALPTRPPGGSRQSPVGPGWGWRLPRGLLPRGGCPLPPLARPCPAGGDVCAAWPRRAPLCWGVRRGT